MEIQSNKFIMKIKSTDLHKYLPVEISGQLILGLVDSGNIFHNVISDKLAENLGITQLSPYDGPPVGTAKAGDILKILGIAKQVPMTLFDEQRKRHIIKTDLVIISQLACGLNLSLPFLVHNKLNQMHSHNSLLWDIKHIHFPLFRDIKQADSKAHSFNTTPPSVITVTEIPHCAYTLAKQVIPSKTCSEISATVRKAIDKPSHSIFSFSYGFMGKIISQITEATDSHLLGINSLEQAVSIDEKQHFKVYFFNESDSPITITKGIKIGEILKPETQPITIDISEICEIETTEDNSWFNNIPSSKLKPEYFQKRLLYVQNHIGYSHNEILRENVSIAKELLKLLLIHWDVFYREGNCGGTDEIEHPVYTPKSLPPIKLKNRPINPGLTEALQEQIATWLKDGVIRAGGVSPWNFPLLPVRKKNGKWRWVVDFRLLNSITRKDSFPIPNIVELLSYLKTSKYFTSLDLAQAFHSIPVREVDREKLSFCALDKYYQFVRMPFGLTSAPNTWARLVTKVLHEIPKSELIVFFDDLLVHSPTLEIHIKTIAKVMVLLKDSGLRLNLEKTDWIKNEVKFLGHLISSKGIKVPPEFSQIIKDWPLPETLKELRSFLGKCNYYRNHFKDFAIKASPLMAHLKGISESSRKLNLQNDPKAVESFENLKQLLSSPELLAYPDFNSNQPFIVDTDYSHEGIGAVLSQVQSEVERPIAFSARRLKTSESQYASHKGELLALIFAIDQFKFFLTGRKFLVRTDNAALSWLKTQKDPKGILMRWLRILSTYDFDIQHRAGTKHGNADALSRASHAPELSAQESRELLADDDQILAIEDDNPLSDESSEHNDPSSEENPDESQDDEFPVPENCTSSQIIDSQNEDAIVSKFVNWVKDKHKPTGQEYKLLNADEKFYADFFEYLDFDSNGILIRKPIPHTHERDDKIVLPHRLQSLVLQGLHHKSHSSGNILADNVKLKYTFPRIVSICRDYVLKCPRCQRLSKKKSQRHTYAHDLVGFPGEKISIDFVGPLSPSSKGHRYLLTLVDVYTRWFEAWPVKRTDAATVIRHLVRDYIPYKGVPAVVHSDNGPAFIAAAFQQAMREFDICKTYAPVYNPKSNTVERFHRTLKRKLVAIMHEFDQSWDEALPAILFSMRTSVNRATGYTPFYLEHGREARMPIDLAIGSPPRTQEPLRTYVEKLKGYFQIAYNHVAGKQNSYILRQRELYKEKHERIRVDDLVWLHTERSNPNLCQKFQTYWTGPYKVLLQVTNVMYKIESYGRWTKDRLVVTVAIDRLKKCYVTDPEVNTGIPVNLTAADVRPYYEQQELLGRLPISDFAPHIFTDANSLPHTIDDEEEFFPIPTQSYAHEPDKPPKRSDNDLNDSVADEGLEVEKTPENSLQPEVELTPIKRDLNGKVIPPVRVKLTRLTPSEIAKFTKDDPMTSIKESTLHPSVAPKILKEKPDIPSTVKSNPLAKNTDKSKRKASAAKGKTIPLSASQKEVAHSFAPRPSPPMGRDIARTTPCEKRRLSSSKTSPASKHGKIQSSSSSDDEEKGTGFKIPSAKPRYRDDPRPTDVPLGATNFCDDCLSRGQNCHRHCRRCKRNLKCVAHSVLYDPCKDCTRELVCSKHCSACSRFRKCKNHRK